jgi:hypothetical protein
MNEELNNEITQVSDSQASVQSSITREDVITRLQEMISDITLAKRQELETLKQIFYKLYKSEQEKKMEEFISNGGKVEEYVPEIDALEEQYKKLMNIIKEKKAVAQEALEIIQQENLKKKIELLDKLKNLVEKANTEGASYQDFKAILLEWKEIKEIPSEKISELWKTFQQYAEQFYDIQRLNNEFREYDFKKNMEAKIAICEEAERLAEDNDVVSAFRKLQKLHADFRETGPISKESREEVWNRFKTSSTIINKKYQQHFEELKKTEQEHLDQKIVICEIIEGIDFEKLNRYQDWNEKTQDVLALQKKWKEIGFAPMKHNQKIFERYRSACDAFFKKKGEFFKEVKGNMNGNLEKKTALCEQVEALKESTDWKETSNKIAQLQKEWREIGPVQKKFTASIWKRFIDACNYFYEQRDKNLSSKKSEESENLTRKKDILAKLQAFDANSITQEDTAKIKELINEWNSIGYVPFKFKDKLAKEYKTIVEKFSNIRFHDRPSKKFGNTNRGNNDSPKEKLIRKYESMKSEIQIYENNLGNLSSFSKSGNSILDSIQSKIDDLKAQAEEILAQIRNFDKKDTIDSNPTD